jgi:hypothetical protein
VAIKLHKQTKATVLRELVDIRLDDAWALLKTGVQKRRNGAVYLGGYAVECALKFRICFERGEDVLDSNLHTHDLTALAEKIAAWNKLPADGKEKKLLAYLKAEWTVELRYALRVRDARDVHNYLACVKDFSEWALNP